MSTPFKIGKYLGVYYHSDKKQFCCRVPNKENLEGEGKFIEEFFDTEREAAMFWNQMSKALYDGRDDAHLMKLNKFDDLSENKVHFTDTETRFASNNPSDNGVHFK